MSTRPSAARPSRRNRASALECCRSGPSRALASRKRVTASANDTPCFAALASAFRGSHSNTYSVYTECCGIWARRTGGRRPCQRPQPSRAARRRRSGCSPLPDLEQSKAAVLSSLTSRSGQRTTTMRFGSSSPGILGAAPRVQDRGPVIGFTSSSGVCARHNQAAARRGAPSYNEAADAGLLSPELAAGIRRVKGSGDSVSALGNWSSPRNRGDDCWSTANANDTSRVRNHAMLAMLLGCGLRRGEYWPWTSNGSAA